MRQVFYEVLTNEPLTGQIFRMTLAGDTDAITAPGQFVDFALDGKFLRRPISVCDWEPGRLTVIYKTVGSGTAQMSALRPGARLDTLSGLGNGYDLTGSGERPLLIGGGVGVPPLYGLCRRLLAAGARPRVILGFNTAAECFYEREFRALGADVTVTTADGSCGVKGFVTAAMGPATYLYACGPEPMLKAVYRASDCGGEFSFEARMACGFGACMGCSCETKYGAKRICRDGPVLRREEIVW